MTDEYFRISLRDLANADYLHGIIILGLGAQMGYNVCL